MSQSTSWPTQTGVAAQQSFIFHRLIGRKLAEDQELQTSNEPGLLLNFLAFATD